MPIEKKSLNRYPKHLDTSVLVLRNPLLLILKALNLTKFLTHFIEIDDIIFPNSKRLQAVLSRVESTEDHKGEF